MSTPPRIPTTLDKVAQDYLKQLTVHFQKAGKNKVDPRTAVDSVMLQSPSGNVYKLSVEDDGTLSTELVYEA